MDRQSPRQEPSPQLASPRTRFICGLLAVAMGLFLLLTGLGVVPIRPRPGDGPPWIVSVAGLCFLLAGILVTVGAVHGVSATGEPPKNGNWWMRFFYYAIGVTIAASLACIGSWIAFGPGPRAFGGPGMVLLPQEGNDIAGRIIFGFGAVVTWLCTIAMAVSAARKLFSGKRMLESDR